MVKFTRDCIMIMKQLTIDLVDTLGGDTADLEMRVGLHSGGTAGVLRGAKGRFPALWRHCQYGCSDGEQWRAWSNSCFSSNGRRSYCQGQESLARSLRREDRRQRKRRNADTLRCHQV
jgi:hypothetical protein